MLSKRKKPRISGAFRISWGVRRAPAGPERVSAGVRPYSAGMPRFDLGLWLVCTAAMSIPFAVPATIDLAHGRATLGAVAVTYAGSLFLGFVLYHGARHSGYRWSRPRPEQAEDYGHGAGSPGVGTGGVADSRTRPRTTRTGRGES